MSKLGFGSLLMNGIIAILIILVVAIGTFTVIQAFPGAQDIPGVVLEETCITDLKLTEAPNGLAGFSIEVEVEVEGTTTSDIGISPVGFPLSSVVPIQKMLISGVDLNGVYQAGATNITLFTIRPCVDSVTIRALDDDAGDPIIEPGTVIIP